MYACMRVCLYTIPCHIKPPTTSKGTLTRVHSETSKRPKRVRSLSYLEATQQEQGTLTTHTLAFATPQSCHAIPSRQCVIKNEMHPTLTIPVGV